MTENEWLASADPEPMLRYLWYGKEPIWKAILTQVSLRRGEISTRKLRLLACACFREFGGPLNNFPTVRHLLDTSERFADGLTSKVKLIRTLRHVLDSLEPGLRWPASFLPLAGYPEITVSAFVHHLGWGAQFIRLDNVFDVQTIMRARYGNDPEYQWMRNQWKIQADLIREIFGNPFRGTKLDPAWLSYNDHCAVRLAQQMYEQRNFHDMPILADALEDAGCDREDVLQHCRCGDSHVLGCWVVDAVLEKT
jgi:hypothetical protein